MVQVKTFRYKNLIWQRVEWALYKHKLIPENVAAYGWKSHPIVTTEEIPVKVGMKYNNYRGEEIIVGETPLKRGSYPTHLYNVTIEQEV